MISEGMIAFISLFSFSVEKNMNMNYGAIFAGI